MFELFLILGTLVCLAAVAFSAVQYIVAGGILAALAYGLIQNPGPGMVILASLVVVKLLDARATAIANQ